MISSYEYLIRDMGPDEWLMVADLVRYGVRTAVPGDTEAKRRGL